MTTQELVRGVHAADDLMVLGGVVGRGGVGRLRPVDHEPRAGPPEAAYKQALAQADSPRPGDYDGRGALSERALAAFCRFFLETALDQTTFMERTLALDAVRGNIERYCAARNRGEVPDRPKLPPEAAAILTQAFEQGEFAKSAVPGLIHASERKARDVVRALLDDGLLRTAHHKAHLTLALPSHMLEDYFPKLCPA